ncbi:type II toxin-antitoxin system RelE/ParE family toxin [Photorhabdus heterorhabditis]|uniref:type II toxin-antitoxin system RelE/ParE family toxin n=1 Tax=Photorhabdus heterorhabditis TaxID=880156 RepID=UPI003BB4EA6C
MWRFVSLSLQIARKDAGYQFHRIQHGIDPEDWKPFFGIGSGVKEMRLRDSIGIYRIMYVVKFDEAILHIT